MNDSIVYVVTRNGRRIEDKNYTNRESANIRAEIISFSRCCDCR